MTVIEIDDPLSKNTARLSISNIDLEVGNPRRQVAEYLEASGYQSRRDSAISLTSLNEDQYLNISSVDIKEREGEIGQADKHSMHRSKRRRSSAQSFSIASTTAVNNVRKKLKAHKKKVKKSTEVPNLELITDANIKNLSNKKLSLTRFRDLILHLFGKEQKPNWINITKHEEINNVVFCFIPGMLLNDFVKNSEIDKESKFIAINEMENHDYFSFFKENFDHILPTSAPGTKESIFSSLNAITNVPLTKKEKKNILDESKKSKLTLWDLLLSDEQLAQNGYPVDLDKKDSGWVETKKFDHEGSHTFALDCEFCQSASGKVLTRISLINFQNEIVMDTLVKPEEEITDYLTKYSGITESKLKDVITSLADVQDKILSIISSEDIIIGHSLESDLNVMKIKHSRIVDTSLVYEHNRGPPSKPSLKWLTEKYLKREIQSGELNGEGHSSVEDARACLDLIKLKIQEGKYFGSNMNEITIFERLNSSRSSEEKIHSLILDYSPLRDWKYDPTICLQKMQVKNDDETVEIVSREIEKYSLVILKLRELEFNCGWSPIPKQYNGFLSKEEDVKKDKSLLYSKLNERLQKIKNALPNNTALILCSSSGSPKEMIRLQNVKRNFQFLERQGKDLSSLSKEDSWDFDKLTQLHEATATARQAMSFITLKKDASS